MTKNKHSTFDDFYINHPDYYNNPSDGLINCVNEYNLAPGKALDVGCGQGRNAIWLAMNGYNVDAFDTAVNTISTLQDKACKNNLSINLHLMLIFVNTLFHKTHMTLSWHKQL